MAEKKIDLWTQIKCVERELAMRKIVYPKRISAGKMTREQANNEYAQMAAVLDTLKQVYMETEHPPTQIGLGIDVPKSEQNNFWG